MKIGEEGEILLKSPSNFLGYYKDLETTAATLRSDGWQHTGRRSIQYAEVGTFAHDFRQVTLVKSIRKVTFTLPIDLKTYSKLKVTKFHPQNWKTFYVEVNTWPTPE